MSDQCTGVVCENGGTCESLDDRFFCICDEGYIGRQCEVVEGASESSTILGMSIGLFVGILVIIGLLTALLCAYVLLHVNKKKPPKANGVFSKYPQKAPPQPRGSVGSAMSVGSVSSVASAASNASAASVQSAAGMAGPRK